MNTSEDTSSLLSEKYCQTENNSAVSLCNPVIPLGEKTIENT